ncbi:hypothetical protein [Occallatibacter savannae]|uniref:hypothetical protein n=1 Tax=Occallatibacter savannae TaxID=1002691 RepID=UPI000D69797E|nr:hypothetical protein [Occallatibacter savannae]
MLTIVWDVDDVLNDLMLQWFTHCWKCERPECTLGYRELRENPPDAVLGIAREEYLLSIDEFRATDRAREMAPNAAVLKWMGQYGAQFRHIGLTARPLGSAPDVAEWVMRHFGAWIRCFGVVHTRRDDQFPAYDRTKGEFLDWIKCGDILVDDSAENIRQAQLRGLKTLLYPQPWNDSKLSVEELLDELTKMAVGV